MKAVVAHAAKDLRLEEQEVSEPAAGEVLISLKAGGICGSDLHYYNHGGFGTVRLKEPMVLGHEVAGRIEAIGSGVSNLAIGQLVAISPSRPCGTCNYCLEGSPNHCLDMRFYGSAMPFPHIQGAFREKLIANAAQCAVADGLTPGQAAMAEPLSVCMHAAKRAGPLTGKRVLVTGCGPIGLLSVMVARMSGAVEIVATDITKFTLDMAAQIGADEALNVNDDPGSLERYHANKGHFDVLFECSGMAQALTAAIPAMRPKAIIVQLGLGGDMTLPIQAMTAKELELRGSFRFHEEFFTSVELMRKGRLDPSALITQTMPMSEAVEAFKIASNRNLAIKAQLAFN